MLKNLLFIFVVQLSLFGESMASFPKSMDNMVLVKESVIPGKDVVLPKDTPLFLQETVAMYNWINDGKGTKLNIFVPRNKLKEYKNHGPYSDGITSVAIYEDQDIVFITEHLGGEPLYGTYDRAGNDISHTHLSFNIKTCYECHTGYKDICKFGTCANSSIIGIFER